MKNLIALTTVILFCICFHSVKAQSKRQHTPEVYKMSQSEKDDNNFDLKQSKQIIAGNIKHKNANKKAAEKKRRIDNQNLMELNASSKTKKENKKKNEQAFDFYH